MHNSLNGPDVNAFENVDRHSSPANKHLSEKESYTCKVCGNTLSSKAALHTHSKLHEPPKFLCCVCSRKFTYKHQLKSHLKLIHQLTQCFHCFMTYPISECHVCRIQQM